MQVIKITSLSGHSPYSITICDITKTYCYSGVTGVTTVPLTINVPTELLGTTELLVVVKDSAGCEEIQYHNCIELTPTPTPTITPTITPTNSTCNCVSIKNPLSVTLNFGFTQCDGTLFYGPIYSATTLYVCGKQPYGDSGLITTVSNQVCVGDVCLGPLPTTTPTPTCQCTYIDVIIDALDIASAIGNTDPLLNNSVFVKYRNCNTNTLASKKYTSSGTYLNDICSKSSVTPITSYYSYNTQIFGSSTATNNGICCVLPTPTPTNTPTPTYTPTTTITPTPTTIYSLFKTQSCCDNKTIKYVMLPPTFLPGTAIVNVLGECLEIISQSEITWVNDYWDQLTTYIDCDICVKYHPCLSLI